MTFHPFSAFPRFYLRAVTQYQLHSPFVYELVRAVLEDRRWYYVFDDIAMLRYRLLTGSEMVEYDDPGARTGKRKRSLSEITRTSASSSRQGRRLFRLAQWLKPARMVELGTSLGFGSTYLAAGGQPGTLDTIEGAEPLARIAANNLDCLKINNVQVHAGNFDQVLSRVLRSGDTPDLIFFDGNHRAEPTMAYFETCLEYCGEKTLFVFDDVHWSAGMESVWEQLCQHPRVTMSIDLWDFSVLSIDPAFKEKQHFCVVPVRWKPWKFW